MRFLWDMGIAQSVSSWLKSKGHDAVHLNDEDLYKLADISIIEKAVNEKRTILTTDMDFGQLLAFSKAHEVSVIQFRTSPLHLLTFAVSLSYCLKNFQIS